MQSILRRLSLTVISCALTVGAADAQSNYSRPFAWQTLSGVAAFGYRDGTGAAAQFAHPYAVAIAASGVVYVADTTNCVIRKVTAGGVVTTLAGQPGVPGYADGSGAAAQFAYPCGLALDSGGNLYVADTDNQVIRLVTPAGAVTTIAGAPGVLGSSDGTGSGANFWNPESIAVDAAGNLYVTDGDNITVRKIAPGGVVTTLAGTPRVSGSQDGTGPAAQFAYPFGIAVDSGGNVYVADIQNDNIRKITPGGVVTTLAGLANHTGSTDATGPAARFHAPTDVAVDSLGNVYVADTGNDTVRVITPAGAVSTLAGTAGADGSADGTGPAARFSQPSGLAVDVSGDVAVADTGNATIRRITPGGVVSSLAGIAAQAGATDGAASAARFNGPWGLSRDGGGNAYTADNFSNTVRRISPSGAVLTLAGTAGVTGSQDGVGPAAQFNAPTWTAVDASGTVYVSDSGNDTIRKIAPDGTVSTFAGVAGVAGSQDGTGAGARFTSPGGLAFDGSGNLYVSDSGNDTIRMITPAGTVTTIAGAAGVAGTQDGPGPAARFSTPGGIAVDASGNLYVVDSGNSTVRLITAEGNVSTLAGSPANAGGSNDGTGAAAAFNFPCGIAVDASGNAYLTDSFNNLVRMITPAGVVSTIGGVAGVNNEIDGAGATAQFDTPVGIACDAAGNLIVADAFNNVIRVGVPPAPDPSGNPAAPAPGPVTVAVPGLGPTITSQPASQSVAPGSAASFKVGASGASALAYRWTHNGAAIAGANGASFSISGVQLADTGSYGVVVTDSGGSTPSQAAFLTVTSSGGPTIDSQPQSLTATPGGTVVLSVGASTGPATSAVTVRVATASSGLTYQWYFNGATLSDGRGVSGTASATLVLDAGAAKTGNYACVVSNSMGSVLTQVAAVIVSQTSDPGRLINLSARANVGTGANILIAGFVSGGSGTSGTQSVLIRGIGPALSAFGVPNALADPQLTLFQGAVAMGSDAGWAGNTRVAQASAAVGAFVLKDPDSADSAIFEANLAKKGYTAQVAGKAGDSGVGLVEVYDDTAPGAYRMTSTRLVNLSARAMVGSGANSIIAGFVIGGSTAKTVLIRASGPALTELGLTGTLPDPKLQLFAGNTMIASNTGWSGSSQIASVAGSAGAFAWGNPLSADSALLITLEPGAYTAEISGASGDTGLALVEIYDVE